MIRATAAHAKYNKMLCIKGGGIRRAGVIRDNPTSRNAPEEAPLLSSCNPFTPEVQIREVKINPSKEKRNMYGTGLNDVMEAG